MTASQQEPGDPDTTRLILETVANIICEKDENVVLAARRIASRLRQAEEALREISGEMRLLNQHVKSYPDKPLDPRCQEAVVHINYLSTKDHQATGGDRS